MNLEHDIFISYALVDDETITPQQEGWVTAFHRALELRLKHRWGKKPKIWRDRNSLRGTDFLTAEIMEELAKAGIMVSVLSPPYFNSTWCTKEIEEFIRLAQTEGRLRVIRNKSCVIKVVKTLIDQEDQPNEIRDVRGYEFFEIDRTTNRIREYELGLDKDTEIKFRQKLDDLVQDLVGLLKEIRGQKSKTASLPTFRQNVFLATTTRDLSGKRDGIRRELEAWGYNVLPDKELPTYSPDLEDLVRTYLDQSSLAVHLVGAYYGFIPEGPANRSVVELQLALAAERSQQSPNFARVIWLPTNISVLDTRQQTLIDALQNDPQEADLLQTSLEELKDVIKARLTKVEDIPPVNRKRTRIYLICVQQDLDEINLLARYLVDLGFKVVLPMFEDDNASQYHEDNLKDCDAALIYYGLAKLPWVENKEKELNSIQSKRSSPLRAIAVYVTSPNDPYKEFYQPDNTDVTVIRNFGNFYSDSLTPFLVKLKSL